MSDIGIRTSSIGRALSVIAISASTFASSVAALAQAAPDSADVKRKLDEILSRPEFQPNKASEGYIDQAIHWLGNEWNSLMSWLRHLFSYAGGAGVGAASANFLVYLFIAFCVVFGAWLLARLIARSNWSGTDRKGTGSRAHTLEEFEAETVTEPDAWLTQARSYAAGGDHRRAFRAVFIAILLQLDRVGLLQYDRSRTNGDYVRLLRGAAGGEVFEPFRSFAGEFDLRWYGHRSTSESDYQRALSHYDRIRGLISSRASTTRGGA